MSSLRPILNTITSFYKFSQMYQVKKGQLLLRSNLKKIIVVTYPKVRHNKKIIETYIDYCYYQIIKYSKWTFTDLDKLKDKSTAIIRFENFISNASNEEKLAIRLLD